MRTDNRQFDGKLFLEDVNIKLNNRLAEIRKDLDQGLKERDREYARLLLGKLYRDGSIWV